jgi:hypothetical protein
MNIYMGIAPDHHTDGEGIWIQKSRCVESDKFCDMVKVNATLSLWSSFLGVVDYFFETVGNA